MPQFRGKRVVHSYTQMNCASPDRVFSLLCPVREEEWVPEWRYHLIYSQSGIAEKDCVFTTPAETGQEIVWIVTEWDPVALRLGYTWMNPGLMTARLAISLAPAGHQKTETEITYAYTGLSDAGNLLVATYDSNWFHQKMKQWEQAINHFLETGHKVSPTGIEC
jgi:hypothetical protein